MKTLLETLKTAIIIALCMLSLFTILDYAQPEPPTSSGAD